MESTVLNEHTRLILKRYMELQSTRLSLLNELQNILDSCLLKSSSNSSLDSNQDLTQTENPQNLQPASLDLNPPSSSGCRHEYKDIHGNQDEYIEQVISISTSGFLEIKDEVKLLVEMLQVNMNRSDLVNLLNQIEQLENQRISEHLKCNLLRRKEKLQEIDLSEVISSHEKNFNLLADSITDLMAEVQAEIVELCENDDSAEK